MLALIWINNVFYLQRFAIGMSALMVCASCTTSMVVRGTLRSWGWHHTPLRCHGASASPQLLAFRKPAQNALCLSYASHDCPQKGQQLPSHVAVLLCRWSRVCGSGGFPIVVPRGSCRGEMTLQNAALLQVCFFDLSHSFLNMQQCKYMY